MNRTSIAMRLLCMLIVLTAIGAMIPVAASAAAAQWRDMITWDFNGACVKQQRYESIGTDYSCVLNFSDYAFAAENAVSSGTTWSCEDGKLVSRNRRAWIETPVLKLPSGDSVRNSLKLTLTGEGEMQYCVFICEKSVDTRELLEIGSGWIDDTGVVTNPYITAYNLTKGTSTDMGERNILVPTDYNGKEVYFVVWRPKWAANMDGKMTVDDVRVRTTAESPCVTLETNGGRCETTVLYPDAYGRVDLPNPTPHAGCIFKGWAESSDAQTTISSDAQFFTPVTLYAQYYITQVNIVGDFDPITDEPLASVDDLSVADADPVYRIVGIRWSKDGKEIASGAYGQMGALYRAAVELASDRVGYFVPPWDSMDIITGLIDGKTDRVYATIVREYEDYNTIEISTKAAYNLMGLDTVELPESLVRLKSEALRGTGAEVIIIPAACEYIASDAFDDCAYLRFIVNHSALKITPPAGVVLIG